MKQTDKEFATSCGFDAESSAGQAAINIRKELAEYGRIEDRSIETDSICANTKIIDTGIIHPSDSIDLIEFTLHMEELVGAKLDVDDVRPMVDAGAEEMEMRKWIQMVLEIRKRKMA